MKKVEILVPKSPEIEKKYVTKGTVYNAKRKKLERSDTNGNKKFDG